MAVTVIILSLSGVTVVGGGMVGKQNRGKNAP